MKNPEYYEPRYISRSKNAHYSFFDEGKTFQNLKHYIFEFDKIVLLGNPGTGKTRELNKLFHDLWSIKEESSLYPFLINLKDFRPVNKFDDLIKYRDWKELPNIIFILDGLDEIAEIHNFISALEVFIIQNISLSIKFVISCRTNIYEKYLVNISNFETFFIDDLTRDQSASILCHKYDIDIENIISSLSNTYYLQTPFFLDLLAGYYLSQRQLPNSDSVIWDMYIERVINEHRAKCIKKGFLNEEQLKSDLKKASFVNELMQKNYFTQPELYAILKDRYLDFIDNPFFHEIESGEDAKKWSFIHRQLQEFFVAKVLSEKTFDEIISIIKIDSVNAIHPSLFNTITFLINIIDKNSSVYNELIEWIQRYQVEILFKADSDRIEHLKEKVFQDYFQAECIEKTLWISTNKSVSVQDIAQFADSDENYNYLLKVINDKTYHYRVRISAIDLLENFRIKPHKKQSLKRFFLTTLHDPETTLQIKTQILYCIRSLELGVNDSDYIHEILEIFKDDDTKEINSSLLNLVGNSKNFEEFFPFIRAEFLRENNIVKRKEVDDVIRGNSWMLQEIILNFKEHENFLAIIKYYFDDKYYIDVNAAFAQKILERAKFFINQNPEVLIRLLESLNGEFPKHSNEKLLRNIISQTHLENEATIYLMQNFQFSKIWDILAMIANEETVNIVVRQFDEGKIASSDDILFFRNYISFYNGLELAENFDRQLTERGYRFNTKLFTSQDREEYLKKSRVQNQRNFDILFDNDKLFSEIQKIFTIHGDLLDIEQIMNLEQKWYADHHPSFNLDSSLNLLHKFIYEYGGPITYENIKRKITDDPFIVFNLIESLLQKRDQNTFLDFEVNEYQEEEIGRWCIRTSQNLNFEKMIDLHSTKSFTPLEDYFKVKLVLFFQEKFEIQLSKEFLLKCIQFFDIDQYSTEDNNFARLYDIIDDRTLFNSQVIYNLTRKKLFITSLSKHIEYALKNKLEATYSAVRETFKKDDSIFANDKNLENYIKITNDIDLLKECTQDIETTTCWTAIKLMVKLKKEEIFCVKKSLEYLATGEISHLSDAVEVLFQLNRIEAVEYYYKWLASGINTSMGESNFTSYDAIEDYQIIEDLFEVIYNSKLDKFIFNGSDSFFSNYISNLSKNYESYINVQATLLRIKDRLELSATSDTGRFYINLLIDKSYNSYINSMSNPLSLQDAIAMVNKIIL